MNQILVTEKVYVTPDLKRKKRLYKIEFCLSILLICLLSSLYIYGAYDREHLQDWLNLFWFIMNEPKDKYDKVLKFIEMAVLSPKKVRYRDAMSSKHSK